MSLNVLLDIPQGASPSMLECMRRCLSNTKYGNHLRQLQKELDDIKEHLNQNRDEDSSNPSIERSLTDDVITIKDVFRIATLGGARGKQHKV